MRLKVRAMSDTYLDEETSLLSFLQGLQHVWSTLVQKFWGNLFPEFDPDPKKVPRKQVEIEELILLGDIADRTLSSTSQIYNHCHAFSQILVALHYHDLPRTYHDHDCIPGHPSDYPRL